MTYQNDRRFVSIGNVRWHRSAHPHWKTLDIFNALGKECLLTGAQGK
jgi:hypothetical protein